VHVFQAKRTGRLVRGDRPRIVGDLDCLAIDDAAGGGHDGAANFQPGVGEVLLRGRDQRIVLGYAVAPDAVGEQRFVTRRIGHPETDIGATEIDEQGGGTAGLTHESSRQRGTSSLPT
jgi:hypothetical protein